MAKIDKTYHELIEKIINEGYWYDDPYREGVQRKEISSFRLEHDLLEGFPAVTTKLLYWKAVKAELIWFLRGWTSPKYLIDNGVHIWDKDGAAFLNRQTRDKLTPENYAKLIEQDQLVGDLGRIYGAQWREFRGVGDVEPFGASIGLVYVDQIKRLIEGMI